MVNIKPFDLSESPLEGTNLIEASSGTGKTYTISGLFLRLLLERRLLINEILVVTFTVAATEELKVRIRNLLKEAIGAFSQEECKDEFLNKLLGKFSNPKENLKHLKEALREFDEAPIFTIHSFCQKMLKDHAFETGLLFDTELIAEEKVFRQEILDDFWRTHFYKASPLFVNYALSQKFTQEKILDLVKSYSNKPELRIIPRVPLPDSTQKEKEFHQAFQAARSIWLSSKEEIRKILITHEGFKQNFKTKINELLIGFDYFLNSNGNNPVFSQLGLLTTSGIQQTMTKTLIPPQHHFFDLCEVLQDRQKALFQIYNQYLLGLKSSALDFFQKKLSERKQRNNLQSFHDLLVKLRDALGGNEGEDLVQAIRVKYQAALIDEFQDTDPIQYEIFRSIFKNLKRILFLIGDPKQAIYSFRGADIFTYLQATNQVDVIYTLKENWRSNPQLIEAVNTLFSQVENPFVFKEIQFTEASPAKNKTEEPFTINNKSEPPLQLWFVDSRRMQSNSLTRGGFIKKQDGRELILKAVGNEIGYLLRLGKAHKSFIKQRPIKEQDIAVLVRTNREATLMQTTLSNLKIPSVLFTTENLFDSREAAELMQIIEGIVEPHNEVLVKTALTTDIIGVSGEKIEELINKEAEWVVWLNKFSEYQEIWRKSNFIRMFRYFLLQEEVRCRLLSFSDGERRLTNILHLAEVLHQEEIKSKLNMGGLLKWLWVQQNPDFPRLQEHQLRLENDENAVKVVTIHKSKGLEYPVVFCPFLWDSSRLSRQSKDIFIFHDGTELILDLGSEMQEENRSLAEKEILGENLRLLYVALTRARNRCYAVWGRFNEAGSSAMAYLFHHPQKKDTENIVDVIETSFKNLTDEQMKDALRKLGAKRAINLGEIPEPVTTEHLPIIEKKKELSLRPFSGSIDRTWKVSSFSSLVTEKPSFIERHFYSFPELPDYDQEMHSEIIAEKELGGIFAFPRGARAGSFMHNLFEHLDFTEKDPAIINNLVAEKLRQYGFEESWQGSVFDMVLKVLSVPLKPAQKEFTLSAISMKDRISELEFYFPLKLISPEKLKNIFLKSKKGELSATLPEQIENLHFSPGRGFMKGFIDLVFKFQDSFYLVDWKSNFLGTNIEDYCNENLTEVMEEKYYFLQYHLYTIALHQYLNKRIPGYLYEKHFGGVLYIFLRGIDPDKGPDFGIFQAKPSKELLTELRQNLIAGDSDQ